MVITFREGLATLALSMSVNVGAIRITHGIQMAC